MRKAGQEFSVHYIRDGIIHWGKYCLEILVNMATWLFYGTVLLTVLK